MLFLICILFNYCYLTLSKTLLIWNFLMKVNFKYLIQLKIVKCFKKKASIKRIEHYLTEINSFQHLSCPNNFNFPDANSNFQFYLIKCQIRYFTIFNALFESYESILFQFFNFWLNIADILINFFSQIPYASWFFMFNCIQYD